MDILSCHGPPVTSDIQDEPLQKLKIGFGTVTIDHLNCVIQKLKMSKSPGQGRISGEMCKAFGKLGVHALLQLINTVWQEEEVTTN